MNRSEFTSILTALQSRQDLSREQMRSAIGWLLTGEADAGEMRQMLERLADKGETIDELAGAAQALRDSMRPLQCSAETIVDTCGTGGDGSHTFNISTAAAIVAAAAGVVVAKHGNRKVTSSTGSADVLSELGINLEASPETVQQCLEQIGICFCFAPHFHPAMRHVGAVRREIPRPTIFNRLGPLANPASANCQVLGVGAADLRDTSLQDSMAAALRELGTKRSIVVRGHDGVDELSLSAPTRVIEVQGRELREFEWCPSDFGLKASNRDALFADDPKSSADCIRQVLGGQPGPKRDVVVLNAAAALWIAGKSPSLPECAELAQAAIDTGAANSLVEKLAMLTQPTS